VKANQAHSGGRVALTTIGVLTVALSWAVVHTVFALRTRTSTTPPVGGIDFNGHDELPDYQDFAYVASPSG
jgi:uncharacterized membrane protein